MSVFNEISDRGQLTRVLQGRLNMTGAAPAPALMPEIAPCLTLENDRPEWGFLKGEFLYGQLANAGAAAGNLTWASLRNPSDSQALMVLQGLVTSLATWLYVGNQSPTTLVNSVSGTARDTRQPGSGRGFVLTGNNVGVPAGFTRVGYLAANVKYDVPIVLSPGWWLLAQHQTVNTPFLANFSWTERAALPSELV